MTIHVLVEEASERAFFDRWGPRLLGGQTVRVHPHQGKGSLPRFVNRQPDAKARGLLDQLPAVLRGLDAGLDPRRDGVLVLVDADNDDAETLARAISGVVTSCAPRIAVSVSIAIEETEAFYLGDLRALQRAFPTADMAIARAYAPDSICGTWELFGRVVGDGGGNKVAWAEAMGPQVTTRAAESRSPSFRSMIDQLTRLQPAELDLPGKKRRYHHRAKPKR